MRDDQDFATIMFTPGPWRVCGKRGESTMLVSISEPSLFVNHRTGELDVRDWGYNIAQARANARLISAAPDLYEVVRQWVATFPDSKETHLGIAARAALLKATALSEGWQSVGNSRPFWSREKFL